MSADPTNDGSLTLQGLSGGRRRKRGPNVTVLVITALGLVGAGAGFVALKKGTHALPAAAYAVRNPSIKEAERCLRNGNLPCAEANYIGYLKKYPDDQRANAVLAMVLSQDGRHKEALRYYGQAEKLGVDTYDFHAAHARTLEATGDLDGAIRANYRALDLVPSLVDVRGALANQLVRKGRADEAVSLLETFDRSLEDRGHPAFFTDQIARIRASRGGETARKAAAEAATADAAARLAPKDVPAAKGQTLVPLKQGPGVLYVPVLLNDAIEVDFTVDSGASEVVLSDDVFRELIRQKKLSRSDYLGSGYAELADGSRVPADLYNLRSLKVGDRTLHNVTGVVSPGRKGQLLLGQSFLRRFKSWSIDNHKKVLVLQD